MCEQASGCANMFAGYLVCCIEPTSYMLYVGLFICNTSYMLYVGMFICNIALVYMLAPCMGAQINMIEHE